MKKKILLIKIWKKIQKNVLHMMMRVKDIILRMPIDEETTVEAVEKYFANFARGFKEQIKDKNVDISDSPEER